MPFESMVALFTISAPVTFVESPRATPNPKSFFSVSAVDDPAALGATAGAACTLSVVEPGTGERAPEVPMTYAVNRCWSGGSCLDR